MQKKPVKSVRPNPKGQESKLAPNAESIPTKDSIEGVVENEEVEEGGTPKAEKPLRWARNPEEKAAGKHSV